MTPNYPDYYGIIGKGPGENDGCGLFLVRNGTTNPDTYFEIFPVEPGNGVEIRQIVGGVAKSSIFFDQDGDGISVSTQYGGFSAGNGVTTMSQKGSTSGTSTRVYAYPDSIEFDVNGEKAGWVDADGLHDISATTGAIPPNATITVVDGIIRGWHT
jgi:hypothetical protein